MTKGRRLRVDRRVACRRAGRAALLPLALAVGLWGCDSGPSGPGMLSGSVVANGEAPGSALLLFGGTGLLGAEGDGGTQAWASAATEGGDELRVLLVDLDPTGAMTFQLQVADVAAPLPSITVLQLADRQNQRFTTEDIQIRIRR